MTALGSNFAAVSSKSKPLGTSDLPANYLGPLIIVRVTPGTFLHVFLFLVFLPFTPQHPPPPPPPARSIHNMFINECI